MRLRRQAVLTLSTIMILALAAAASAESLTAKETRAFNVSNGAKLTLDNVNGKVTVTAWNQPRIQVEAEKKVRGS
jgi:hypothetical protein